LRPRSKEKTIEKGGRIEFSVNFEKGEINLSKKKSILMGLLLSSALMVVGCIDKETSTTDDSSNDGGKSNVIMVSGDTVSEMGGCVLASRYAAGDKIVFRMNALDANNEQMEDAKLQVHLSTGEVLDMELGVHSPPDAKDPAKFWTAAYPVTENTPTGTLEYYVTAEAGDAKGEFRPFNVQPSLITIVDPSAAGTVPEGAPAPGPEEAPAQ